VYFEAVPVEDVIVSLHQAYPDARTLGAAHISVAVLGRSAEAAAAAALVCAPEDDSFSCNQNMPNKYLPQLQVS